MFTFVTFLQIYKHFLNMQENMMFTNVIFLPAQFTAATLPNSLSAKVKMCKALIFTPKRRENDTLHLD